MLTSKCWLFYLWDLGITWSRTSGCIPEQLGKVSPKSYKYFLLFFSFTICPQPFGHFSIKVTRFTRHFHFLLESDSITWKYHSAALVRYKQCLTFGHWWGKNYPTCRKHALWPKLCEPRRSWSAFRSRLLPPFFVNPLALSGFQEECAGVLLYRNGI